VTYLPGIYRESRQQSPGMAGAYEGLAVRCHGGDALGEKTRRLTKMGIAVGSNSEGRVKSHARRAVVESVTTDELRHAALLASTAMVFAITTTATKWVDKVV
jgi:4-carboxymuconolactone decarboxylase